MARTIKPEEHQEKRNQILEAAQQLIYTKGYEQLTIQDLLDRLGISKGAFYHYFGSKQALLEAIVDQLGAQAEQIFTGIVRDPALPTLVKLQQFFDASGRWKTERKDFLLALLRVWYTDDNVLVRSHMEVAMGRRIAPLLGTLIEEGVREGVLEARFPDETAAVVLALLTALGNGFAQLILSDRPRPEALARASRLTIAFNDALERALGAPAGSLHLLDEPTMGAWFDLEEHAVATAAGEV